MGAHKPSHMTEGIAKRSGTRKAMARSGLGTALASTLLVLVLLLSSSHLGTFIRSVDHVTGPSATEGSPGPDIVVQNGSSYVPGPDWKTYPYKAGHINFPDDEGAHPEASTEWWYMNGHLITDDGRRYDYMVCFYTHYVVAAALFDESRDIYINYSKAFADVQKDTGRLYLRYGEDELYQVPGQPFTYQLNFQYPGYSLSLRMGSNKPPVLIDGDGVMNMGRGLSYYYSLTDMSAVGTIITPYGENRVTGSAWMDRQWGYWNPSLQWDWFSIDLDNGMQVLGYNIFEDQGNHRLWRFVSVVDAQGRAYEFNESVDCCRIVLDYDHYWRSPGTMNLYALGWNLTIPDLGLTLSISPFDPAQEVLFPTDQSMFNLKPFWEGACGVTGTYQGTPVNGRAFVETTYDYGHVQGDLVLRPLRYEKEDGHSRLVVLVENRGGHSLKNIEVEMVAGDPRQGGKVLSINHLTARDNSTMVSENVPDIGDTPLFITVDLENRMAETNEWNNIVMVTLK